jgi:signal transduction histidine kinase
MLSTGVSSKKRLALTGAFLVAFLVVLNVTTLTLYRRARTHLDNELGERLRTVATGLAHVVEYTASDSLGIDMLQADAYNALYLAREENALSNIVVLTPSGTTMVDLAGYSQPGEPNPFVDLDYSAVTLARSGIPSYTNLYRSGGVYMKSAYAPIAPNSGDVVAILGVEAGAGFFTQLRQLTTLIVLITALGVTVVIVLGLLFYAQTRSLDRAEAAVVRKDNLATMGRMVANIAHEIRNPLSVIRTSSERLRRKYKDDDDAFSYISEEVDELNRILTGYLQFAQSQTAEFSPQPARKIISRCLLSVQPDVAQKRLEVVEKLPADEVYVNGDENRIRQAVLNVLLNAVQAAEKEGRVEVALAANDAHVEVVVSDDGPGIDAKLLSEVTKPFFTTKADGSGLGLNIAQTIVEEHDGSLDIQSRPGEGTRVTMTFPRWVERQTRKQRGRTDG